MTKGKKETKAADDRFKVIAVNRIARHEYDVLKVVEAGIILTGTEIKSVRAGKVNIRDAYARRSDGEMWLYGAHIAEYSSASYMNHEPTRPRKLLLHRGQIEELSRDVEAKGCTLVPLRVYIKDHHAKVELALARGRKQYDKREAISKRDVERRMQHAMRQRG